MVNHNFEYVKGLNGHFEISLWVENYNEVDKAYDEVIKKGAISVLKPTNQPWGQRTCYIS
jgi:uncharacterized glyoxalase superfamily protein PhnB